MDMSVGSRLWRQLHTHSQNEMSDTHSSAFSPRDLSTPELASSLTTVMNRCKELGIFGAEKVQELLSKAVCFNQPQLASYWGMINTISCLYEGWDIHLDEARDFIETLFRVDDHEAQDIYIKIVEGVLTVDVDLQARFRNGELPQSEYDRIKGMPVASDRLNALLEVPSRE